MYSLYSIGYDKNDMYFITEKVDLLAHDPEIRRSILDNFRNKIDCYC